MNGVRFAVRLTPRGGRDAIDGWAQVSAGKRHLKARVSLPLFFNPQAATVIECLPTCRGPGNPAKYEPVAAGPYVQALIEQSNRIGRPGVMQRMAEERLKLG